MDYGAKVLQFLVMSPYGLYKMRYYSPIQLLETYTTMNSYLPVIIVIRRDGVVLDSRTADWQTSSTMFTYPNALAGTYTINYMPLQSYDINQDYPGPWDAGIAHNNNEVFPYNFASYDELEIFVTISQ